MVRRSVAVVPFGARGDVAAGAWGRQLARRLVDRFAGHPDVELKPVYLVALPEAGSAPGYLVLGSTPDPALAAQYGASLGTTHALSGVLAGADLELTLVAVDGGRPVATLRHPLGPDGLAGAETAAAAWLADTLDADPPDLRPLSADATAYATLLEGLDEEVNATLLAQSDPAGGLRARAAAAERFARAIAADPALAPAEDRLLVLAAESLERGDAAALVAPLEALSAAVPRSWRAHYLLGELRRLTGDTSGAVVALEHADALHPLGDADSLRLAELHLAAGAEASARARLGRIRPESPAYAPAQDTLGVLAAQRGDLAAARAAFERAVRSGTRDGAVHARLAQVQAAEGDLAEAEATIAAAAGAADAAWELALAEATLCHRRGALDRAIARYRDAVALGAPADARLGLARALVAAGDAAGALVELDALVAALPPGELAGHARRLRFGLRQRPLEVRLERAGQAALGGPDDGLAAAAADLSAVLAADPDLWEAHFASGLVARRRGDGAVAEAAFERVLALWPEQPDALHELGLALLGADRTNEALERLERAARLRPDDPGYLADAGFAQLRAGHLAAARQRLERARTLDTADPVTAAYLAELARVEAALGRPGPAGRD